MQTLVKKSQEYFEEKTSAFSLEIFCWKKFSSALFTFLSILKCEYLPGSILIFLLPGKILSLKGSDYSK